MMQQNGTRREMDDAEAPEPERMINPDEEAGMDLAELEDPPQAEGQRYPEEEPQDGEMPWRDRRKNEGAD